MFLEKEKKESRIGESLVLVFDVSVVYENLFLLFFLLCPILYVVLQAEDWRLCKTALMVFLTIILYRSCIPERQWAPFFNASPGSSV